MRRTPWRPRSLVFSISSTVSDVSGAFSQESQAFQQINIQLGQLIKALSTSGVQAALDALNTQLGSPFVKIVVGAGADTITLDGTTAVITVGGGANALTLNGATGEIDTPKFTLAASGTLAFLAATTATSASSGTATALPSAPALYLEVSINGTVMKIPAYLV